MVGLFSGAAPRVRTIAPSAPFLDTLIDALIAELDRDDPFALADCIILAPNRRGAQAFTESFARRNAGGALLPTVRPLADLEEDPDVWGPEPLDFDIPPAIDPMRRRFEIARLVRARDAAEGGVDDPVRALAFADELTRLLDSAAAAENVDWSKLEKEIAETDLAEHWVRSAQFLSIITQFWPQHLQDNALCDPADRKARVLRALAQRWREQPPQKPVIIAGSTGSLAPTRVLMRVVASLPRGVIVLPGLDHDLDDAAWDAMEPGHPQFTMKETLLALEVSRADVDVIGAPVSERAHARHIVLRETMAPAMTTADWRGRLARAGGADIAQAGLEGIRLIEAHTEEEEAAIVAALLRETYEDDSKTAAFVTPDAGLARRVAAKLARWNIAPRTTIGTPFATLPIGALIMTLCRLAEDDGDQAALASLLKSPLVGADLAPGNKEQVVARIEHKFLRGARTYRDLAALCTRLESDAQALMADVHAAMAPLRACAAAERTDMTQCADALIDAVEALHGADRAWSDAPGAQGATLLRALVEHGAALHEMAPHQAWRAVRKLVLDREAPPTTGGDARIAILGALEARLERADRLILGGLNEGVWPKPPPEDGLLSRRLRKALGLASPDLRLGLAAHDFSQLAATHDLILTRAHRVGDSPRVASRWIWRLRTLAKAAGADAKLDNAAARRPVEWVRALNAPHAVQPATPPKPCPPIHMRPHRVTFTDAALLVRDPYAIFAKRVLGLRALRAVGEPPGPAERGTAIHDAIEAFEEGHDPHALMALLHDHLTRGGFDAAQLSVEMHRLREASEEYVIWQNAALHEHGVKVVRERNCDLAIDGGVTLHGRADALHLWPDGTADIIDFKSGQPPGDKEVNVGLQPQLTLEGAALMRAGFENVNPHDPRSFIYWRFAPREFGARAVKLDNETPTDAAEKALARLVGRLRYFQVETNAYVSKPRPKFANQAGEYDLLARRAEWADAEGEA